MHTTSGRWRLGLALALTTAVCWGLLPIALEVDARPAWMPWTLTWYRFATAAVVARRVPRPGAAACRCAAARAPRLAGCYAVALLCLVAQLRGLPGVARISRVPTVAQVLIQLAPVLPAVRRPGRVPRALRAAAVGRLRGAGRRTRGVLPRPPRRGVRARHAPRARRAW
ncbi:MAG: hypothetical protein MZV70_43090 [Desulfobacterales bacterium]|nr:hypothetical protein [Desulfobacterales bacterium]